MNTSPLVSILCLSYNHSRFIDFTLDGLIKQRFNDCEILILDDASSDASADIIRKNLERLEEKYSRVEFFENENNDGSVSRNANKLINIAQGKYLFFF